MKKVMQMLKLMAEINDKKITEDQIKLLINDLIGFNEESILYSLKRCRLDLNKYPSLHEIIERIPNWHPSANEAWAIIPRDESNSCCWTKEIKDTFFEVYELYLDDKVAARMAFIESYNKKINKALLEKICPKWDLSLGYDKNHRQTIIEKAVLEKKISHEKLKLLSNTTIENKDVLNIVNKITSLKQIESA